MPATSTIEKMDATTWFSTLFSAYESNLNGHRDHPHAQFRRAGFDALVERTFPTRRDEDWKYTGLTKVLANKYQEGKAVELSDEQLDNLTIQGFDSLKLVFINGVLSTNVEDLPLPDGLRILRLEEAFSEGELSSWIQSQSSYEGGTTKNTFVQLNQAFGQEGVVIIAEPNAQFTLPIELLYINSVGTEESHFSNPQVFVHAQRGASFSIIERYEGLDDEDVYLTNTVNRIYVEENTHLHHYRLQLESSSAYQINSTFVQQDRSSTYSSYNLDLGGGIVRNNISALSKGSGTETNLFGTYVINGTQHVDNQTFIDHAVPHCVSNELYRGVLDDKSRGVFNGKVMVRQDAQKTNAFQQNNSIVLSPTAVMDTKPQLEIYADDVKCSHGATIGQIDEGAVFYLQTRGLQKDKARSLLQMAFLDEVLSEMKLEVLQNKAHNLISTKLNTVSPKK